MFWSGTFFPYAWLDELRPPTVIATAPYVSSQLRETVERYGGKLWVTGEVGALTWTPQQGVLPAFTAMASDMS